MSLKLPDSVLSMQDLKSLIQEVEQYAHWYGQTAIKNRFAEKQSDHLPPISEAAAALVEEWAKKQPLSPKSLDDLLAALHDMVESIPHITITVAGVPPESLKRSLTSWCRDNLNPDMLVNFKFNRTILGGMVVSYGSHVYDWSFRRQILVAREKFAEVLRHV